MSPPLSGPLSYDIDSLLSTFERFVEFDIQQGALRRDDVLHGVYLNAFRQTFQAETVDSRGIAQPPLTPNFQNISLTSSTSQQSTESPPNSAIEGLEETMDASLGVDVDLMGTTSAESSAFDTLLEDFFAEQDLCKSGEGGYNLDFSGDNGSSWSIE